MPTCTATTPMTAGTAREKRRFDVVRRPIEVPYRSETARDRMPNMSGWLRPWA